MITITTKACNNNMGCDSTYKNKKYHKPNSSIRTIKTNQEIVKEMEDSLKSMELSINKMEDSLNKAYNYKSSVSTVAVNVDSVFNDGPSMNKTSEAYSNHQLVQNFKFTNQNMEFGPHNVFYNCTFVQCPLKFGAGNLFENCRNLHLYARCLNLFCIY